jgi:hypothetical protein
MTYFFNCVPLNDKTNKLCRKIIIHHCGVVTVYLCPGGYVRRVICNMYGKYVNDDSRGGGEGGGGQSVTRLRHYYHYCH